MKNRGRKQSSWAKICKCFQIPTKSSRESTYKTRVEISPTIPSPIRQQTTIPEKPQRKLLVLDLDQTLVNCSISEFKIKNAHKCIEVQLSGEMRTINIQIRNHCQEFLETMSTIYDVAIYTASTKEYADAVLSFIDPQNLTQQRLYREHCIISDQECTKDLSKFNRDLKDIILIDDLKSSLKMFPDNGYLIKAYQGSRLDYELIRLIPFLKFLANCADVRPVNKQYRNYLEVAKLERTKGKRAQQNENPSIKVPAEFDEQADRQDQNTCSNIGGERSMATNNSPTKLFKSTSQKSEFSNEKSNLMDRPLVFNFQDCGSSSIKNKRIKKDLFIK